LRILEGHPFLPVGATQEISVDVRVIAATNRVLIDRVAAGEFREDLFYRLNVIHLTVPPLRERRGDVPVLLEHFLRSFAVQYGTEGPRLSPEAIEVFLEHDWPGNVRELKNVVERAAILSAESPVVRAEHLMIQRRTVRKAEPEPSIGDIRIPREGKLLEDIEREAVAITLKITNGNQAAAARMLGISRPTLAKKMPRGNSMERAS
jgi:transcriptional regulator with PAS, ATPase and Fis domain